VAAPSLPKFGFLPPLATLGFHGGLWLSSNNGGGSGSRCKRGGGGALWCMKTLQWLREPILVRGMEGEEKIRVRVSCERWRRC